LIAEVGIVEFAGQASWCVPRVWHFFQLPFFQVSFSFRDTDLFCDQHLPHESDRIISAGSAKVRGLGLFLFLGPCWTCLFDDVLLGCCCFAPSEFVWVVGLCRDQILLFDPYFAKNQQGVYTGFVDWCLFGCFAASSAVASLTFFARPFACGLLRTWRIFPPPHTTLIDFLVALCQGVMPAGLGGDLR